MYNNQRLDLCLADELAKHYGPPPTNAIILGSGSEDVNSNVFFGKELFASILCSEFKCFSMPQVPGHTGKISYYEIANGTIVINGRRHFYEGCQPEEIVRTVRALAHWGVRNFLICNAAGSLQESRHPGTIMLIKDHYSFGFPSILGDSITKEIGVPFTPMNCYNEAVLKRIERASGKILGKNKVWQGCYNVVPGPRFESTFEVALLGKLNKMLGYDGAVGMSTIPEIEALNHLKYNGMKRFKDIRVIGVSFITNYGAGISKSIPTNDEVKRVMKEMTSCAGVFLCTAIEKCI